MSTTTRKPTGTTKRPASRAVTKLATPKQAMKKQRTATRKSPKPSTSPRSDIAARRQQSRPANRSTPVPLETPPAATAEVAPPVHAHPIASKPDIADVFRHTGVAAPARLQERWVRQDCKITEREYGELSRLKKRASALARPMKRGQLLRVALQVMVMLDDAALFDALDRAGSMPAPSRRKAAMGAD